MEIVKKPLNKINKDVLKIMGILQYKNYLNDAIQIKGSSSYNDLKYYGDFDLMQNINLSSPRRFFNHIKNSLIKILSLPNTWFLELKIQLKDNKKIKFYDENDFLKFKVEDFEKIVNNIDFIKLDLIIFVEFNFFEVSNIFYIKKKNLKIDFIQSIKDEIKELEKEGNYFKVLKRKFSIYIKQKNITQIKKLTEILNSTLGKKYQLMSMLETIKKLLDITDDKTTIKKIYICLIDNDIEPNIKKIDGIIKSLKTEINNEAKKLNKDFYIE